ncbi:hypothetical protein [Halobacillus campisalis]|uniref:Aerobactin siderophore biosynthesis IucA/IucC-like C-terminal domain-containing protein n=1 Tax=Halobacillus campisalis TaxID=435909 RepID=A0ABW2K7K9_9BACI|nr:hypothetical protein [Halobacillus campisalis]
MSFIKRSEEEFLHQHFRYYMDLDREIIEVIQGKDLQTVDGVQQTLDQMHAFMGSEFMLTTASILSKRYGYYIATVPLALMTIFNKFPDMRLSNIELVRIDEDKKWLPQFNLLSKEVSEPANQTREEWMNTELEKLFNHHVRPLFLKINQLTRLSMDVMWENTAIYIFWLYERQFYEWYDDGVASGMKRDFYYVVRDLPGEVFGMKSNPFTYFLDQPILSTGARERKCCCLSYKKNKDSTYCKVCPHLSRH